MSLTSLASGPFARERLRTAVTNRTDRRGQLGLDTALKDHADAAIVKRDRPRHGRQVPYGGAFIRPDQTRLKINELLTITTEQVAVAYERLVISRHSLPDYLNNRSRIRARIDQHY